MSHAVQMSMFIGITSIQLMVIIFLVRIEKYMFLSKAFLFISVNGWIQAIKRKGNFGCEYRNVSEQESWTKNAENPHRKGKILVFVVSPNSLELHLKLHTLFSQHLSCQVGIFPSVLLQKRGFKEFNQFAPGYRVSRCFIKDLDPGLCAFPIIPG